MHCIKQGGKLDVHEDFNIHSQLQMLRSLNLILYMNKDWGSEWGGDLEFWDRDMTVQAQSIQPIFNRAVIFRTDMHSNHGHPHSLQCPENQYRRSLASYYYRTDSAIGAIEYRSTQYKKLPGVDDGLDELREIRKKGRLT